MNEVTTEKVHIVSDQDIVATYTMKPDDAQEAVFAFLTRSPFVRLDDILSDTTTFIRHEDIKTITCSRGSANLVESRL